MTSFVAMRAGEFNKNCGQHALFIHTIWRTGPVEVRFNLNFLLETEEIFPFHEEITDISIPKIHLRWEIVIPCFDHYIFANILNVCLHFVIIVYVNNSLFPYFSMPQDTDFAKKHLLRNTCCPNVFFGPYDALF